MKDRNHANVYRFEDRWRVPFSAEKVWEVLARPEDYPRWWRGVYLSAKPLDNVMGERRVSQRPSQPNG